MRLSEKQKAELAADTYSEVKSFVSSKMWREAAIVAQELIDMLHRGWPNPINQSIETSIFLLDAIVARACVMAECTNGQVVEAKS